ncbi:YppG family protein [Bacillaceae bacterium Marseille-Q3522]|nr:YppG family protein [Bacillaceae bacterium Marseille-Q3522]
MGMQKRINKYPNYYHPVPMRQPVYPAGPISQMPWNWQQVYPMNNFSYYPPYPYEQPLQSSQPSSVAQNVFQNPLQQTEEFYPPNHQPGYFPYMNPYPKNSFMPKQPAGMKSVMNSFKAQDGSYDIPKMVDTAGQMINAFSQVSSMVKGLGGFFKV